MCLTELVPRVTVTAVQPLRAKNDFVAIVIRTMRPLRTQRKHRHCQAGCVFLVAYVRSLKELALPRASHSRRACSRLLRSTLAAVQAPFYVHFRCNNLEPCILMAIILLSFLATVTTARALW